MDYFQALITNQIDFKVMRVYLVTVFEKEEKLTWLLLCKHFMVYFIENSNMNTNHQKNRSCLKLNSNEK